MHILKTTDLKNRNLLKITTLLSIGK